MRAQRLQYIQRFCGLVKSLGSTPSAAWGQSLRNINGGERGARRGGGGGGDDRDRERAFLHESCPPKNLKNKTKNTNFLDAAAEEHHVALAAHVLLALEPQRARLLGALGHGGDDDDCVVGCCVCCCVSVFRGVPGTTHTRTCTHTHTKNNAKTNKKQKTKKPGSRCA